MDEIKEDVFKMIESKVNTYDNYKVAFAHCISKDLKMGAGIARQFIGRYGTIQRDVLQKENKNKNINIGKTLKSYVVNPQFVAYHLVTKESYWLKPTYKSLLSALEDLHAQCVDDDIRLLVIPRLGCGLDKLEWSKVKQLIIEMKFPCYIIVCVK
jgi:hypothetical protein